MTHPVNPSAPIRSAAAFPLRLAAPLPLLVGCTTTLQPNRLEGTYPLVRLNGQALPTGGSPLPPRCPPGTDECYPTPTDSTGEPCRHFIDRGALSLDPRTNRFALFRIRRSSCGSRILGNFWSTGTFLLSGETLTLRLGRGTEIHGRVDAAAIRIQNGQDTGAYAREPLTPVELSPSGTYRLASVAGESLPVDLGARATPGAAPTCSTMISDGGLELEEMGERDGEGGVLFSLTYELRDSCTGELLHQLEERGSAERIGRFLGFTVRLSRNTVSQFPALLGESEILVFRDRTFVFEDAQ